MLFYLTPKHDHLF